MREEIARRAASSFAPLMRLPVDRRSMAVFISRSFFINAFCAMVALTLVLTTAMMASLF